MSTMIPVSQRDAFTSSLDPGFDGDAGENNSSTEPLATG